MSTQYTGIFNPQDNYGQWGHFEQATLNATGLATEDNLFTDIMPKWEQQAEPGSVSNMMEMNRLDSDITNVSQQVITLDMDVRHQIKDIQYKMSTFDTQIQDLRSALLAQAAVINDLDNTIKKQATELTALRSSSSSPVKKKQKIFAPQPSVTYASVLKPPQPGRIIMPALSL